MMKSVTYFAVPDLPLIEPGDDLAGKIVDALKQCDLPLVSGDIVVVAQKVVSKAENRYVDLDSVVPSARALQLARVELRRAARAEQSRQLLRARRPRRGQGRIARVLRL